MPTISSTKKPGAVATRTPGKTINSGLQNKPFAVEVQPLASLSSQTVPAAVINFGTAPWKDDDAAWFAANPRRAHRLRAPHRGEAEALGADPRPGETAAIVVRQVRPGLRLRQAFICNADTSTWPPKCEEAAAAIFDALTETMARGGGAIPSHLLQARLFAHMAAPGGAQ